MRFFSAKAVGLVVLIIWISFCLTDCATFSERAKIDAFEQVTKNYRFAMLLSDFEQAVQISGSESDSPGDIAALKNFHVVSYTAKKIEFSGDKSKVSQAVEIEYYRVDSMQQKTIRDVQEWTYKPETTNWILTSGLPKFD